jgi:hypothetical protein
MAVNTTLRFHAGVVDDDGIRATATSHLLVDDGQTIAAVKTALGAWEAAFDAVSGGKIVSVNAGIYKARAGGDKADPVAGADVEEVGIWSFNQTGTPFRYGQAVPALDDAVLAGQEIDPTNAAVIAWEALLLGAVLGGNYTGVDTDALASVYKTLQGTRKHRRQLTAKSTTVR